MTRDEVYAHQNLGNASGIGARCALILVDFVNGFVDPDALGGPHIEAAAHHTEALLAAFRARKLPVAHSQVVFADDQSDKNVFCLKAPPLLNLTKDAYNTQFVPYLLPQPGELIVRKTVASAFFATGLADWLRFQGADTAVVVGCTTSGCVRATVIDAMQHNFRTVVIEDCVGDRALEPHEANLFDMGQKYADVMSRDTFLQQLPKQ